VPACRYKINLDESPRLENSLDLLPAQVRGSLLPLCLVDDRSIAVVALDDSIAGTRPGNVLRLVLADVPVAHQLRPLDVDPLLYVASLEEELTAREAGLKWVLDEIGPAYQEVFIDQCKRPRDFVVRPVRIACQNVIVALAAFNQDSAFDGLGVIAWQTCEVPHVGTHEANRALTALTLCDAFKSGGTMEVRFDRPARVESRDGARTYSGHPEGRVPAQGPGIVDLCVI